MSLSQILLFEEQEIMDCCCYLNKVLLAVLTFGTEGELRFLSLIYTNVGIICCSCGNLAKT